MKKVIHILMQRDNIEESEATKIVKNFIDECMNEISKGNIEAPFELIVDELGLEPDYLEDLIPNMI